MRDRSRLPAGETEKALSCQLSAISKTKTLTAESCVPN
jgi:hypothetical protein